jgi:hypothetical protein
MLHRLCMQLFQIEYSPDLVPNQGIDLNVIKSPYIALRHAR